MPIFAYSTWKRFPTLVAPIFSPGFIVVWFLIKIWHFRIWLKKDIKVVMKNASCSWQAYNDNWWGMIVNSDGGDDDNMWKNIRFGTVRLLWGLLECSWPDIPDRLWEGVQVCSKPLIVIIQRNIIGIAWYWYWYWYWCYYTAQSCGKTWAGVMLMNAPTPPFPAVNQMTWEGMINYIYPLNLIWWKYNLTSKNPEH